MKVEYIPVDKIREPENVMRSYMDDETFIRLRESIREKGILNPLILRKKDEYFEIVAGHRRYLASKSLGLNEVPAFIIEADDKECDLIKAHENFTQEQVNPLDKALWILHLMKEYNLTVEECARLSGVSETSIRNFQLVLGGDEGVLQALRESKINMQQAIELNRMPDKSKIPYFLELTLKSGATASQIRLWRIEEQNRIQAQKEIPAEEVPDKYDPKVQEKLKVTCPLCWEKVNPENTISVHLCYDCYFQFKEQVTKMIKEAENATALKDQGPYDTGTAQGEENQREPGESGGDLSEVPPNEV